VVSTLSITRTRQGIDFSIPMPNRRCGALKGRGDLELRDLAARGRGVRGTTQEASRARAKGATRRYEDEPPWALALLGQVIHQVGLTGADRDARRAVVVNDLEGNAEILASSWQSRCGAGGCILCRSCEGGIACRWRSDLPAS